MSVKTEVLGNDEKVRLYADFIIQLQIHSWSSSAIGRELADIAKAIIIAETLDR